MPALASVIPNYNLYTPSATALANSLSTLHGLRVLKLNAQFRPAESILALTCLTQLQMLDVGICWVPAQHIVLPDWPDIIHRRTQLASQLQSCLPNCRILLPTLASQDA